MDRATQLEDLPLVAATFPAGRPGPAVPRTAFLERIDQLIEVDHDIVIVTGPPQVGKTTLLAQFVERHRFRALSIFIDPANRLSYQPNAVLADLVAQLGWVLDKDAAVPESADLQVLFQTRIQRLVRSARQERRSYYLVVDGLENIPSSSGNLRDELWGMVPVRYGGLKVVTSGDSQHPRGGGAAPFKELDLVAFAEHEAKLFFEGSGLNDEEVEEVRRTFSGIPGRLATVRRLVEAGEPLDNVLKTGGGGLLDLEWDASGADLYRAVLALVGFSRTPLTPADVDRVLGIPSGSALAAAGALPFVQVTVGGHMAFVSLTWSDHVRERLSRLRKETSEKVVDDLLADASSLRSITELPDYFRELDRPDDLIEFLSPDRFGTLLESSQSLGIARTIAAYGTEAAAELNRPADAIRFGIHQSSLNSFAVGPVWEAELRALMALGDRPRAIALAQGATLKADQLHLLSVLGRAQKADEGEVPKDLLEQVRRLTDEVDAPSLGERAITIASELFHLDPELALRLVERSTGAESGEHALDHAYLRLTLDSLLRQFQEERDSGRSAGADSEAIDVLRRKIKDPTMRGLTDSIAVLVGGYSADKVLVEIKKIEKDRDKLLLLRRWAAQNPEEPGADRVVTYALDLAIQNTDFAQNAGVLRDLAIPLPHIDDPGKCRDLIGRIDTQLRTVSGLGPPQEVYRTDMILARAEALTDATAAAALRLNDVQERAADETDPSLQAEVLAGLLATLSDLENRGTPPMEGLDRDDILRSLDAAVDRLLSGVASHYAATRRVVRTLARTDSERALALANRLNTEPRRDAARGDVACALLSQSSGAGDVASVRKALGSIQDPVLRDATVVRAVRTVRGRNAEDDGVPVPVVEALAREIVHIRTSVWKCEAAATLLAEASPSALQSSKISDILDAAWNEVDLGWRRIDAAYEIATTVARVDGDLARSFVDRAEKERRQTVLDAALSVETFVGCCDLAIRAFEGLLEAGLDAPEDIARLGDLFRTFRSHGDQAVRWTRVAFAFHRAGRAEDCKQIVQERVRPLMESLEDTGHKTDVYNDAAPVLYAAEPERTLQEIEGLSYPLRDEALAAVINSILTGCLASEPYEHRPGEGYSLDTEAVAAVQRLLDKIESDHLISGYTEDIVNTLSGRRTKKRFDAGFVADTARRLKQTVEDGLPSSARFISHKGYQVYALSQIAKLQPGSRKEVWEELVKDADSIPNTADRALVQALLVSAIPKRREFDDLRETAVAKAQAATTNIPTADDQRGRYLALAEAVGPTDKSRAKRYYEDAFRCALDGHSDPGNGTASVRSVLSAAYRYDPELADSLARMSDERARASEAPGQVLLNMNTKAHVSTLKLRQAIAGRDGLDDRDLGSTLLPRAAFRTLGSVNAGRATAMNATRGISLAVGAARRPFMEAQPVYALVLQSLINKYKATDQAPAYIRGAFEACLQGVELVAGLTRRMSNRHRVTSELVGTVTTHTESISVMPGERDKAHQYLLGWLQSQQKRQGKTTLTIVDPYFGTDDMDTLALTLKAEWEGPISVLTSRKQIDKERIAADMDSAFSDAWRTYSDTPPPDVRIVAVGLRGTDKPPIHDRYWLTPKAGLRLGASSNGLGRDQQSDIVPMATGDLEDKVSIVSGYISTYTTLVDGKRVRYLVSTI